MVNFIKKLRFHNWNSWVFYFEKSYEIYIWNCWKYFESNFCSWYLTYSFKLSRTDSFWIQIVYRFHQVANILPIMCIQTEVRNIFNSSTYFEFIIICFLRTLYYVFYNAFYSEHFLAFQIQFNAFLLAVNSIAKFQIKFLFVVVYKKEFGIFYYCRFFIYYFFHFLSSNFSIIAL